MEVGLVERRAAAEDDATGGPLTPACLAAAAAKAAALEARGAELAGVLATAAAGLVEVVAEAVATEAWRGSGIRSAEHWVGLRFGLSAGRAHRLVAAARALDQLPACRAAFSAGEITEDQVAAVARAQVGPHHDAQVADLARVCTVRQLQRALSFLPPAPPADSPDDPIAPSGERLTTGFGDDGTWFITGRADADRGALVDRALLAARDRLFRARHADRTPTAADLAEISGIDALEHLAEVALDALDPATASGGRRPSPRFVVDYHLPAGDPDLGRLHLGPAPPAWLRSLITCDTDIRTWITGHDGNVNLGRRRRTVDARLRTVVEHRDGGCCIPGCQATRWLTIHHLHHWVDGGPTDTANLAALCAAHHRLVHRGELVLTGNPDTGPLAVATADGRPVGPAPPRPPNGPPDRAAVDAGLPPARWINRSGERADWRWLVWADPSDARQHHPT